VFVLKPVFQPQSAKAAGAFAGIQFSYSGGNHVFFNVHTGDVWEYGDMATVATITQSMNSARTIFATEIDVS
jgi:hypothetical protein